MQSDQRHRSDPRGAVRGPAPAQPGALSAAGRLGRVAAGPELPGARVAAAGQLRLSNGPRRHRPGQTRPPAQTPRPAGEGPEEGGGGEGRGTGRDCRWRSESRVWLSVGVDTLSTFSELLLTLMTDWVYQVKCPTDGHQAMDTYV